MRFVGFMLCHKFMFVIIVQYGSCGDAIIFLWLGLNVFFCCCGLMSWGNATTIKFIKNKLD
jgi:hypothetical protein